MTSGVAGLCSLSLSENVGPPSGLIRDVDIDVDEYLNDAPLCPAVSGIAVPPTISGGCVANFRE
jgi:hypothetical protein